ncbi:MAG: hypothetical protein BMS9Abin18_0996 [Zetaproteobacteria bacterium]|nr:MAG: hypothetical protein BMS9Abin18_0996 [Zetaproteobacteria bacterium]
MENQGTGQREFERFPVEFKVEVYALEEVIRHYLEDACLRDISDGGACFFSVCPDMYSVGQRLFLSIRLPGTDKMNATMQGEAIVAWIGEQEGGSSNKPAGSRIGVFMDDLMAFNSVVRDQTGGNSE